MTRTPVSASASGDPHPPEAPDPELSFRAATERDVPALVELIESAYRGEASRAGWTTEADLLGGRRTDAAGVREVLDADGSMLLCATGAGELLACCQLVKRRDDAYFGMFAVRPGRQGGGIGGALLAEAERIALERWRRPLMRMTVITARTTLIAWYLRRGYRRTGERHPFPYGDERFGIPRRADLEFEVLVKPLA